MIRSLFALLCVLLFSSPVKAQELSAVAVIAEESLSIPLTIVARNFAKTEQRAIALTFVPVQYEGSQIAEGVAADVLVTTRKNVIEELRQQGLIDIYSIKDVARNRLVLAGPLNTPLEVRPIQQFPTAALINAMEMEPKFVLANAEQLAFGGVSREVLRRMDAAADMEPYTVYLKQMQQMVDMIAHNGAYGLLLNSDALTQPGIKVIGVLPESAYTPIIYQGVVLAGENMDKARDFLNYLASEKAQAILRSYGVALN